MEKRVSIRDANLHFSRYVTETEGGDDIVVTRRGEPVVRIVRERKKPQKRKFTKEQQEAWKRLEKIMNKGIKLGPNPWPGREVLYGQWREEDRERARREWEKRDARKGRKGRG